jgi:hypothetical protein
MAVVILVAGCHKSTNPAESSGKAFLDEKKQLPPRLEWNREVGSRKGGTIAFRVSSQGPFAVTVVTANAYKAMQTGNRKAMQKSDILLTVDVKESTYEGKVTVPPGSSYFIIENQTDKNVEIQLECFEGS